MFALQKSHDHQGTCVPNVLPCRINHNGTINASKRYWAPSTCEDGKMISYFRGRKLHGKAVKVPKGYRGAIIATTETALSQEKVAGRRDQKDENREDGEMELEEVLIMEEKAEFEEVVVWGHEVLPDEGMDPYLMGMGEWVGMAEKIHEHSPCVNEEGSLKEA